MAEQIIKQGQALLSSKVFWFNILALAVAVASLFGYGDFKPSPKTTETIGSVVAIINILLRLRTSEPITRLK